NHTTQSINIAATVYLLDVADLFGSQVKGGVGPGRRQLFILYAGQAKVRELDNSYLRQQGILGLDVAVDQVQLVSVLQGRRAVQAHAQGVAQGEFPQLLEPGVDVAALGVVHRQVWEALFLADLVTAQQVGMVELDQHAGLAVETLDDLLLRPQRSG